MEEPLEIRPRWYRSLHLWLVTLWSTLALSAAIWLPSGALSTWLRFLATGCLAALWLYFARRTYVRCDSWGVRSDRPMSRQDAAVAWEHVGQFVASGGAVRARLHDGGSVVVLDPSGDNAEVAERLEVQRRRRQKPGVNG